MHVDRWVRLLPDLLAFGISLGVAYGLGWEARDLVWSLWLGSLVLGYLTLLSTLGAGAYCGLCALRHKDFKKRYRWPAVLIGAGIGLFFLGFFSLHFCGFHAGHSVFLQMFFPLPGVPSMGFGDAFINPPLLWALVFRHLLAPYGLFLIPAIIAERHYVFGPLIRAVHMVSRAGEMSAADAGRLAEAAGGEDRSMGDVMARPYRNVIRMHLLIFFFAACHFLKVQSFLVYAVVYSVYFFPWRAMKAGIPAASDGTRKLGAS